MRFGAGANGGGAQTPSAMTTGEYERAADVVKKGMAIAAEFGDLQMVQNASNVLAALKKSKGLNTHP